MVRATFLQHLDLSVVFAIGVVVAMEQNRANLSISWKAVSIASTIIAITACTIAAIVATVKNADTLSVVALGVAVIAFIIQIIVFIVQAAAASEQSLRAQELYGSTIKVLATIEEKSEGTRMAVSTINDKMLGALIGKFTSVPDGQVGSLPVGSITEFARAVNESGRSIAGSSRAIARSEAAGENRQANEIIFPDNKDLVPLLSIIDELAKSMIYLPVNMETYAEDWLQSGSNSQLSGIGVLTGTEELYGLGLLRRVRRTWAKGPVFTLSDDGKIVARAILAQTIPEDAPQEVVALRDVLAEFKASSQQRREETVRRIEADIPVEE
jgi:hypothetical protein